MRPFDVKILSEMKKPEIAQHFEQTFGTTPTVFRAPGRVNLIGEHTDYNEGFVLPAVLGFYTQVAIAPRPDGKLIIRSQEFAGDFEFDVENLPSKRGRRVVRLRPRCGGDAAPARTLD